MANNYTEKLKNQIIETYKREWSVSAVINEINLPNIVGRSGIVDLLKREGIYEGLNGTNYLRKHKARTKRGMLKKHGVENYGQISRGFGEKNKLPYTKIKTLDEDYKIYRVAVERLTTKNIKNKIISDYCEYTGIKFADNLLEQVNPNDPRKRSVDHKNPIVICYLTGKTVEEAADITNLAYVLRYVNTIKGNTALENFMLISKKIRQVFINENCPHN